MPAGKSSTQRFAETEQVADCSNQRDLLLMEHLPTVRYIARRIHERLPQHVDLDDLVSAGVVGLIDAFSKFDHTKRVQFKSYAQFRIRGAILDSLRTLDWSPRELRRKGERLKRRFDQLRKDCVVLPLEQEIAAEMKLTLAVHQQLLGDLKGWRLEACIWSDPRTPGTKSWLTFLALLKRTRCSVA